MNLELELLVQRLPALRALPPELIRQLGQAVARREATDGEYLFRQREGPPASVYYLVSASAEILLGPPGDERRVSLVRPGQLVGWVTVFTGDLFPVSARIVEPGEVLEISADALRGLIGRHPALGPIFASTMAQYLNDLFQGLRTEVAPSGIGRRESFPFRMRVSEAMSSPVLTLPADASARQAARTMASARTGSVIVCEGGRHCGIVTEQDLIRRVFAEGRDPDAVPLREVMSTPVACLQPDDYLYEAIGAMRTRRVRHLAVVDGTRLVGVLSMRSLMGLTTSETIELAERIEGAETFDTLAEARSMGQTLCAQLLDEGLAGNEVSQLLSHVNRDLYCRALEIAIADMDAEGWGEPPLGFCFILMGSHGRSENHFHTDQDHGMILADYAPEEWERVEPYFMELGTRVSQGLARVGFSLCRGNVMSSNPVWRKCVREWKEQIRGWYANPSSNAVRYSTLFYDFQPVWGDVSLGRELRHFITRGIQRNFQLLQNLFGEASRHKVPLTFFRNFVTEKSGPHKGQMDLKRSGFLFVEECARILALRHGVTQTGTVERLQALCEKGAIPSEEAEFIQTSYNTLMYFLLTAQVRKMRAGDPVDNYIDPRALPIQERYVLRHALEATGRLQGLVHASFGDVLF